MTRTKLGCPPGLLLGVCDGGSLERRISRLMDARMLWGRRWRIASAAACLVVMGAASLAAGMLGMRGVLAQGADLDWQKAAGGKMSFDVASIRLGQPGTFTPPTFPISNDDSYTSGPNSAFVSGFTLESYIEFAYKVHLSSDERRVLLTNQPGWVLTDAYVVRAKADHNVSKDQLRLMMQALLAERFKLAVHFETREMPVFALTLIKPGQVGPKLVVHSGGPACDVESKTFTSRCDAYQLIRTKDRAWMQGSRNTTMNLVAASLTSIPGVRINRPVVDQTGLSGKYDFTLEWTPEAGGAPSPDGVEPTANDGGISINSALQEQLGMKLVPMKAPVQVLVIDHVERPTEN